MKAILCCLIVLFFCGCSFVVREQSQTKLIGIEEEEAEEILQQTEKKTKEDKAQLFWSEGFKK